MVGGGRGSGGRGGGCGGRSGSRLFFFFSYVTEMPTTFLESIDFVGFKIETVREKGVEREVERNCFL